jgi:Mn-dependent DtxR family transcriptional regulator
MDLIEHENAHLDAFKRLLEGEGIAEKVCFKLGETFDAAMTDEAEERLRENLERMTRDHGPDHPIVKSCRYIKGRKEAEEFSQMKGAQAVFVHPTGQV